MKTFCTVSMIFLGLALFAQDVWTLRQCVDRAWEMNLDIQRSELSNEIAGVNLIQNKLNLLPTLNGGMTHGYNWGQTIDPFTNEFATDRVRNNNLFLSSDLVLFSGFQLQNRLKQSRVDLKASEEDLKRMRNDIGLIIAQAYLNVLFNQEQVKAAESQVEISERQVQRMTRMVDAGQEAIASLLEVESQLASDVLVLTQIENSLVIAKLNLTNLLLLTPTEAEQFDIAPPSETSFDMERPLPSVGEIYGTAKDLLPQLKAAELRVQSSDIGLDIAKGGRSPQLLLRGSIGSGYSGNNQVGVGDSFIQTFPIGVVDGTGEVVITAQESFNDFEPKEFGDQLEDNFNQSLSFSLTFPIFNGFSVTSDISRAKLNYELSQLDKASTNNQLLQDVQQAHADATAARRSYQAAQRSLEAMQLNFENSEKRFEQQMLSPVDFNVAKARLAVVETDAVRAKYDFIFRMTIIDFYQGKPINIE
ncbi:MAG: TolC family protein [Flavobacteriales bacterium]|nr:TolC family protein [Flavobacteriales bacterium]